jgi:ribosomal protein S18 acetylase RimI-like enzyme
MTVAGLQSLSERGIEVGMLYVDAANVPAVTLYYDLGFTLHQVRRAFVLDPIP